LGNPKLRIGASKPPVSTIPGQVILEIGTALQEGAIKYGRHNYREEGTIASIYYDAAFRHLISWWEGEDIDPDSGLPHVVKAIASLVVLRDAQLVGKEIDDRPVPSPNQIKRLTEIMSKFGAVAELADAVDSKSISNESSSLSSPTKIK
jgi:hypothetical protein